MKEEAFPNQMFPILIDILKTGRIRVSDPDPVFLPRSGSRFQISFDPVSVPDPMYKSVQNVL